MSTPALSRRVFLRVTAGAAGSFNPFTGDFIGTTLAPLDPGLDPLGNYGGPSPTHRLKAGSFAIGSEPSTRMPANWL